MSIRVRPGYLVAFGFDGASTHAYQLFLLPLIRPLPYTDPKYLNQAALPSSKISFLFRRRGSVDLVDRFVATTRWCHLRGWRGELALLGTWRRHQGTLVSFELLINSIKQITEAVWGRQNADQCAALDALRMENINCRSDHVEEMRKLWVEKKTRPLKPTGLLAISIYREAWRNYGAKRAPLDFFFGDRVLSKKMFKYGSMTNVSLNLAWHRCIHLPLDHPRNKANHWPFPVRMRRKRVEKNDPIC